MPPRFIYFDLGNVLLYFSHARMVRQMAQVAGVDDDLVRRVIFDRGLAIEFERGEISSQEYYERFCAAIDRRPPFEDLCRAANDIFEINVAMRPILASLLGAGYRLGLLSNTNRMHYDYFSDGRYSLIPSAFRAIALSFEIRAMKPEPEIYQAAADLAGVAPQEIFFTDDIIENVEGAREAGFDAVPFTSARLLASELRSRGVRFNY